ncbi:MAG: hypothetical protein ACFFFC_04035 [Candidatus Thorarchaeota archaeon]
MQHKKEVFWKIPLRKESIAEWRDINEDTVGLGEFSDSLWSGAEAIIRSEMSFKAKRRASILGFHDSIDYLDKLEDRHHKDSMKHIKRAIKQLKECRSRLSDTKLSQLNNVLKSPEKLKDSRRQVMDSFRRELLEYDLEPEVAEELVDIAESSFNVMMEDSNIGTLLGRVEENLNNLVNQRSKSKTRGRGEYHSPLEEWKWYLIAAVAGIGIYVLMNCLVWVGCVFVFKIAVGTSAVVSAIAATGC